MRVGLPVFFKPLHEPAVAPGLMGWKQGEVMSQRVGKLPVGVKDGCGFDCVGIKLAYELGVHCRPHDNAYRRHAVGGEKCIFGRRAWSCDKPAVARLFNHRRAEELCRPFHYGIYLGEISLVACVQIMFPQVGTQPRAAGVGCSP